MSSRRPSIEDSATISRRMAEIQRDRMAAIAGCTCQRTVLGEILHRDNCPLRSGEPPRQGIILTAITLTAPEVETLRRRWLAMCKGTLVALLMALAFDPHVLVLSWGAERQERVPATSRSICTAAMDAIRSGRWLADDPPLGMRCEQGSAFAPGSDCIEGYNCRGKR